MRTTFKDGNFQRGDRVEVQLGLLNHTCWVSGVIGQVLEETHPSLHFRFEFMTILTIGDGAVSHSILLPENAAVRPLKE